MAMKSMTLPEFLAIGFMDEGKALSVFGKLIHEGEVYSPEPFSAKIVATGITVRIGGHVFVTQVTINTDRDAEFIDAATAKHKLKLSTLPTPVSPRVKSTAQEILAAHNAAMKQIEAISGARDSVIQEELKRIQNTYLNEPFMPPTLKGTK